jgi:acyl-CoA thioesterase-1
MKIVIWILGVCVLGIASIAGYMYVTLVSLPLENFSCASQTSKPVIAAFGDSLVAGYGAESQQGFVGPLSTQIGTTIINNGESGDTTSQALQRLPDVLQEKPNIVIVLLSGNDALQQIPIATTKSNLSIIISTLQRNNIRVVLVGVLGGIISDPFKPMFQSLAKTYNVAYVPNILNGLITNSKYMSDEVHPNAAGYDIVASKIYPALNQVCEEFIKNSA